MTPHPFEDYLRLRRESGLSPKSPEQGSGAIAGSWSACHIVDAAGTVVAMGRTIGDGGWYFHIVDIAIGDPPGQRLSRSLGFDDVAPSLGMALRP